MNLQEEQFQIEFEKMGYTVLRNGWPDFLIVKDGAIAGVEIKGKNDTIKPNQQRMMDILSGFGIRCFVGHWQWHEITNYMEMAGREDDVLKVINERYMRKLRGIITRLETTRERVDGFRYLNIRISRKSKGWQRRIDDVVERLDLIIKDMETPPTRMLERWFEEGGD